MAEVRKKEKKEATASKTKNVNKKEKETKKKTDSSSTLKKDSGKKSLWTKFRIFCHGVKSEFLKVHWPSKDNMIKYSIATIFFIIFCSVFFYLIDVIFALIQSLIH